MYKLESCICSCLSAAKTNDTAIISTNEKYVEDFISGTCDSCESHMTFALFNENLLIFHAADNEYVGITCTEKKYTVFSAEDDAQSRGYQDSQTAFMDFFD